MHQGYNKGAFVMYSQKWLRVLSSDFKGMSFEILN